MEPAKSNSKTRKLNTCLLCSRNHSQKTQKKRLFELLIKLFDLWDKEFTESTKVTFSSDACKNASFCNDCKILISGGVNFKRKLAVVKEEIANYFERDTSDDGPAKKQLRSVIGSATILDTDSEAIEAENNGLESSTTGHEDHTYSATTSSVFYEVSTMISNLLDDSDHAEDMSGVSVDGDLRIPAGNTTRVPLSRFTKFKTAQVMKPSSAKNVNQRSVARKRDAQVKALQSSSGETKEKKRRVIHISKQLPELSTSQLNDESSNLETTELFTTRLESKRVDSLPQAVCNPRKNVAEESVRASASEIVKTTRPVQCLSRAKGISMKPAFGSNPSNLTRTNELSDNWNSMTSVHEENPGNLNAATNTNNMASNQDPGLKPPLQNQSDLIYYATPTFMVQTGILTFADTQKLKWSRLYRCFFCEQRFCSGISLRVHLQLTHNEGTSKSAIKFQCPRCLKEFEKTVFDHDLKPKNECFCHHFGEKTVVRRGGNNGCCSQETFEKFAEVHLRGCKGYWYLMPQPDECNEECISCGQDFPLDLEYYAHLRTHYQTDLSQMFSCPLCMFQTSRCHRSDSIGFKMHLRKRHGISICGNEQYFCNVCNSLYMPLNPELESGRLVPEEYAHFKNFALEHSECESSSATRQTEFKCKWCPEIKNTPKELVIHEGTVHTKNLRKCDQCDFECYENTEFKAHMGVHGTDFVCDRCAKVFPKKQRLKNHIAAVHTGERNFMCEECGSAFFSKCHLRVHKESVHKTIRDTPCPECGKCFKSKKDVRSHVYQVHEIKRKAKPREKVLG